MLDAFFPGVKRVFVLSFDNTDNGNKNVERDNHKKYFLPRVNITNYNVLIDARKYYYQPIGDQTKKYDKIRNIAARQRDDYTTLDTNSQVCTILENTKETVLEFYKRTVKVL